MKKFFNIILSLILCACCMFSFSACDDKTVNKDNIINPRNETIKVGYIDYAPLNYMYKGKFTGFNTKLAISVFNTLGYNVDFVLVEPVDEDRRVVTEEDVFEALDKNEITCFWGALTDAVLNDTDKFYFSYNYMENSPCLVVDNGTSIDNISHFEGKTIAFGQSSSGEFYFNDFLSNIPDIDFIKCEKGQKSALHKANSPIEDVDCAIVDTLCAYYNLEKTSEYGNLVLNTANNPNAYQIGQKNYLRVAFKKDAVGEELKTLVNKTLEFFASTTKTVNNKTVSLLEYLAVGETYTLAELKDFIIKDFSSQN
ncbi:MAG: amino acid ABC transporter substrate-binding protein [Clostridiales bacterium]|nr:amino acid ABC transporter substrate-binding protein [Clostridiales bacterium]